MSIRLGTRISRLEQKAQIERGIAMRQLLRGMFEEMHVSEEDSGLLDVMCERGGPATAEEQATMDRFSAEYERAYQVVSRARNSFR